MIITEKALEEKRKELQKLNKKLEEVLKEKRASVVQANGNSFHDNFEFEQAEIQERAVRWQIKKLNEEIRNATIISENSSESDKVKIGSNVTLIFSYENGLTEEIQAELVELLNNNSEFEQISLNSPIGKAIYNTTVGDEVIAELPSGEKLKIKITSIEN